MKHIKPPSQDVTHPDWFAQQCYQEQGFSADESSKCPFFGWTCCRAILKTCVASLASLKAWGPFS